jgi:hypothetical protein
MDVERMPKKKDNFIFSETPENQLAALLKEARQALRMSPEALAQRTKIQPRFIEIMEQGRFRDLPSPAHGRGFVVSACKAMGANEALALQLWSQIGSVSGARKAAELLPEVMRAMDKPSAPVLKAPAPPANAVAIKRDSVSLGRVLLVFSLAMLALAGVASSIWQARVQRQALSQKLAVNSGTAASESQALTHTVKSGQGALVSDELVLKGIKDSWVVMEVDGQAFPKVFIRRGEKQTLQVQQRAVLLLSDAGLVRVWWRKQPLGVLGPKSVALNGLVFERGQRWRRDSKYNLALSDGEAIQSQETEVEDNADTVEAGAD